MKCEIIIDPNCEERVDIYIKEKHPLAERIQQLAQQDAPELLGYSGSQIVRLDPGCIHCIAVIGSRVYALCDKQRYLLKERLYTLEEKLPECFVKINQSCLGNIRKMERFDTSLSGTLKIRFKNGHTDYVSRRQLKLIKERIGI